MPNKNFPSTTEQICNRLFQKQYKDIDLFSENKTPCYWKISDLVNIYPDLLDINRQISVSQTHDINKQILSKCPQFISLTPKPIHVLNTKETYTLYDKTTNLMKVVKNGNNQHLTRVACEYLFRQFNGTEIEQAYFLSPNKTIAEIANTADDIKFEHIRNQISGLTNILASYTKQAAQNNPNAYRKTWGIIWQTFYNTRDINTLKATHNIKSSLIDYMSGKSLEILYRMLQHIVSKYQNNIYHNIDVLDNIVRNTAFAARTYSINQGLFPELQLTSHNSRNRITKIQKLREKFWMQYYPETLQK